MIAIIIAAAAMWFIAYQVAPLGYEISFGRVVITVVLTGLCAILSEIYLARSLGYFQYVAYLASAAFVVKVFLRLPFGRSLLVAAVYTVVLVGAVAGLEMLAAQGHATH